MRSGGAAAQPLAEVEPADADVVEQVIVEFEQARGGAPAGGVAENTGKKGSFGVGFRGAAYLTRRLNGQ